MSHLLSSVLAIPVVGVVALLCVSGGRQAAIRGIAVSTAALTLVTSLPFWFAYQPRGDEWQFAESLTLLSSRGLRYAVGIDGMSLLLVLMTTVVGFIAILTSRNAVVERTKTFYVAILALEASVLGVFVALDFVLLVLCWLVAVTAMCVLIARSATTTPTPRLTMLALCATVGSVALVIGVLGLHVQAHAVTGVYTFNLSALQHVALPPAHQTWIFITFFVAFAATIAPLVMYARGPMVTPVSIWLAAIVVRMGTYGVMRISLPILPDASRRFAPTLLVIAVVLVLYSAVRAMLSAEWPRVIAYTSVGHAGVVMLGLFALTPDGLTGAIVHQATQGLSVAALFLVASIALADGPPTVIADRARVSGLALGLGALFLVAVFAFIGMPGLSGFVGARSVVSGLEPVSRVLARIASGEIVLIAGAVMWLFVRMVTGWVRRSSGDVPADFNLRTTLMIAALVLLSVWIGVHPAPVLARVETSVARVVLRVSPEYGPQVADCLNAPPPKVPEGLPAGMETMAPCDVGAEPVKK